MENISFDTLYQKIYTSYYQKMEILWEPKTVTKIAKTDTKIIHDDQLSRKSPHESGFTETTFSWESTVTNHFRGGNYSLRWPPQNMSGLKNYFRESQMPWNFRYEYFSCMPITTLMKIHFRVDVRTSTKYMQTPMKIWLAKWHIYFHEGYTLTKIGHFQ